MTKAITATPTPSQNCHVFAGLDTIFDLVGYKIHPLTTSPKTKAGIHTGMSTKHEPTSAERRDAILAIFKTMEPQTKFTVNPIVGKLQGPIKLSNDVKDEQISDYKAVADTLRSSPFVLLLDDNEIDPSWSILEQIEKCPPTTWEVVFKGLIDHISFISGALSSLPFYPLKKDMFNAFRYTKFHSTKVVLVGLDPYPQETDGVPDACGLCFSYRRDFPIPKWSSLKNIYKELKDEYGNEFTPPDHGDLREWCRQGVLMLNMALSVAPRSPKSHLGIWGGFMSHLIPAIVSANPNVIFVMWGSDAQKMTDMIGNRVAQLTTSHPSGQSARRGFLGCNHFRLINEHLTKTGQTPIDWNRINNT
jgi:uracil-DNA glycosylase